MIHSFIHSCVHTFIHAFTNEFIHSIHAFVHSSVHACIQPSIHSSMQPSMQSSTAAAQITNLERASILVTRIQGCSRISIAAKGRGHTAAQMNEPRLRRTCLYWSDPIFWLETQIHPELLSGLVVECRADFRKTSATNA